MSYSFYFRAPKRGTYAGNDFEVLQFTFIYTLYSNRENEPPNQEVARRLLKEVQEVEHVKNDSLCTERRIFGMFPFGIDCFNWSGPLN